MEHWNLMNQIKKKMSNNNDQQKYDWKVNGVPLKSTIQDSTNLQKEQVKSQVKKWMEEGIQAVLDEKQTEADLLYCRPQDIIEYITSIGGENMENFNTNGWQWDYWFNVKVKGREYIVCGDGYYSDGATFLIKE